MPEEPQGQDGDGRTPAELIHTGLDYIAAGLTKATGDTAEHPMLQDARTHLNAAAACIDAFLGKPAE